ncbi:MAG: adenylyl-sulfate kinase [Pseudomonadales bacterium]
MEQATGLQPAAVIWITGISRSGKTTLANGLKELLGETTRGPVQVLDGSFVRDEVGGFFGYSREERVRVSRILAVTARLLAANGVCVIVTSITPYQESRDYNRATISKYYEIFLKCDVEICSKRDPEGLFERAKRGDISQFIGVDSPFELPKSSDLVVDTGDSSAEQMIEVASAQVQHFLNS